MDDDPDVDQMIVESHETNDLLLSFGEQKCAAEIGEESPLESGDIGPVMDPESPKKPIAVKDLPDQTENKTSVFRRKEWTEQSQQADLSGSVKSSTTSLRKPSRRSSQRLPGQEGRRGSPASQLPLLSQQKPSRGQAISEADAKDPTWVSQRTGKVMKCRSQQTSLTRERKALSEILCSSSDECMLSNEESEATTGEDDITSYGETDQESCLSSNIVERKISKHSSLQHLERFGSRRSSQKSSELPSTLGPKYSQVHPTKGMDSDEDVTWISQRTGREMKCKAQQTSQVWGSREPSGFFGSSRRNSQVSQEESGYSTSEEVTTSGESVTEEPTTQEPCHSIQQEGSISKHASRQQLGRPDARRNSQQTMEQRRLLNLKSSHEEFTEDRATENQPFLVSQRTGKEMKCKFQQTSLVWENKTFSDVLRVCNKESDASRVEEEDATEAEEGGTQMDAQHRTPSLESGQDIQRAEEQKSELHRKKHKSKTDQAQQTVSAGSLKKELVDSSQQTEVSEGVKMSLVDLRQDPDYGSEQTDVQGSQQSSQELVGQDSGSSSPLPEPQGSQKSSQQSLRSEIKTTEGDEAKAPSDIESEAFQLDQKASCIRGAEETTWISRKTGRTVRNQSQQTDRSWLQYFAAKSQKLKKCISQQTDESFLQLYKTGKQAFKIHRKSHTEPDICRCTLCGEAYGEEFPFDMDMLFSFSSMSISSNLSSQEKAGVESIEEPQPSPTRGDEGQPQTQEFQGGGQQVGGQESPKDAGRESQRGSVLAAEDQTFVRWADERENSTTSESSLLYTEGEDEIQQTYSLISFEDGIWLNRKTGKLLITHSQQTSETSVPKDLEKSRSTAEEGPAPTGADDSSAGMNWDSQHKTEVDKQQPSGQESRRGSQQGQNGESCLLPGQPGEESLPSADEVEKLVCSRLSEATLLSIEFPDAEDGPVQLYTAVSLEKGSWMNVKTGKLLASQTQQTEVSFPQNSAEDEESAQVPGQKSLEEGQVDIP